MSMIKKYVLPLLISNLLYADTIGGEVSLGLFAHSLEGESSYQSSHNIDFSDTLNFSHTQDIFFSAYIEHPFLLFPNFKFSYNPLSYNDNSHVSAFSWGKIENYNGNLNTRFSLDYTDITLYYELVDNSVEVDAGLTFRYVKGEMSIQNTLRTDRISYSTLFPLLYAKTRFNIPSTDISLQAEANLLSLSVTSSYDYSLSARYTFMMGLALEAGYKKFHLESDELFNSLETSMDFSGPYTSVIWDF